MTISGEVIAGAEPAAPASADSAEPDRREQILAAALDVFAERGFAAATIKRIAAAAELKSPALLYWYFPNKEALFVAVLERFAPTVADVDDAVLLDLDPDEFLRTVLGSLLARFDDEQSVKAFRVLLLEVPMLRAAGFELAESPALLLPFIERYLERQIEVGALRPHDPTQAMRAIVAMVTFNVHSRSSGLFGPPPPNEQFIDETVALLLNGLRP